MKLYSKNLDSIHALKQEKERIKNELKDSDDTIGSDKNLNIQNGDFISNMLSSISSGSLIDKAINVAPAIIDIIKRGSIFPKKNKQTFKSTARQSPNKSVLTSIATEFIGGYLKWKAVELAYKGIKLALRSDKAKEAKEKNASFLKKHFKRK